MCDVILIIVSFPQSFQELMCLSKHSFSLTCVGLLSFIYFEHSESCLSQGVCARGHTSGLSSGSQKFSF